MITEVTIKKKEIAKKVMCPLHIKFGLPVKSMTSQGGSRLHGRAVTLHPALFHTQAESAVEVTCQYVLFGHSLHL